MEGHVHLDAITTCINVDTIVDCAHSTVPSSVAPSEVKAVQSHILAVTKKILLFRDLSSNGLKVGCEMKLRAEMRWELDTVCA